MADAAAAAMSDVQSKPATADSKSSNAAASTGNVGSNKRSAAAAALSGDTASAVAGAAPNNTNTNKKARSDERVITETRLIASTASVHYELVCDM